MNLIVDGQRPTILPEHNMPPRVEALIRRCWGHKPAARPTFDEIVRVINDARWLEPEGAEGGSDLGVGNLVEVGGNLDLSLIEEEKDGEKEEKEEEEKEEVWAAEEAGVEGVVGLSPPVPPLQKEASGTEEEGGEVADKNGTEADKNGAEAEEAARVNAEEDGAAGAAESVESEGKSRLEVPEATKAPDDGDAAADAVMKGPSI
jgi:hypothetical protein